MNLWHSCASARGATDHLNRPDAHVPSSEVRTLAGTERDHQHDGAARRAGDYLGLLDRVELDEKLALRRYAVALGLTALKS